VTGSGLRDSRLDMGDPHKKKLRRKAKKVHRRERERVLDRSGHHSDEKKHAAKA